MHVYLLIAGIFCLVIAGGVYTYTAKKNNLKPEYAVIYVEEGSIFVKGSSVDAYKLIATEQEQVLSGTFVKTDTGYGYVLLPDNSILSIDPRTELQLVFKANSTSIIQILGTTYHRVQSLTKGASYEVITPTTVASVRGTKFGVTYATSTKVTKVAVSESIVAVKQLSAGVNPQDTIEKSITQGEVATIYTTDTSFASTTINVSAISDDAEVKFWIEEKTKLDSFFEGKTRRDECQEMLEKVISTFQNERSTSQNNPTEIKREDVVERVINKLEEQSSVKSNSKEVQQNNINRTPAKPEQKPEEATEVKSVSKQTEIQVTTPTQPVPSKILRTIDFREENITAKDVAYLEAFYELYESLFLIDQRDMICENTNRYTAKSIYAQLELFATERGYELPNKGKLIQLAENISNYCLVAKGDPELRTKIKAEFDGAYPYSE